MGKFNNLVDLLDVLMIGNGTMCTSEGTKVQEVNTLHDTIREEES